MAGRRFKQAYEDALRGLIGRRLGPRDGYTERELAACERRLEAALPTAVREYYRLAGRLEINVEHNRLYPPEELTLRDGKIVFMEENQRVVFWGFEPHGDPPDPAVFQAPNEPAPAWYPEEQPFSQFIIAMLRWQRGVGTEPA